MEKFLFEVDLTVKRGYAEGGVTINQYIYIYIYIYVCVCVCVCVSMKSEQCQTTKLSV